MLGSFALAVFSGDFKIQIPKIKESVRSFVGGNSCTIDALGNIYMTGMTFSSSGIATAGAHQTANAGLTDAFLVKFNSSGVRQWGTYYGGGGPDDGFSCTTDASGNVYMTGQAQQQMAASGIATPGSHQSAYGGGYNDAFLVKFDSNGLRQWGTYYGGSYCIIIIYGIKRCIRV